MRFINLIVRAQCGLDNRPGPYLGRNYTLRMMRIRPVRPIVRLVAQIPLSRSAGAQQPLECVSQVLSVRRTTWVPPRLQNRQWRLEMWTDPPVVEAAPIRADVHSSATVDSAIWHRYSGRISNGIGNGCAAIRREDRFGVAYLGSISLGAAMGNGAGRLLGIWHGLGLLSA